MNFRLISVVLLVLNPAYPASAEESLLDDDEVFSDVYEASAYESDENGIDYSVEDEWEQGNRSPQDALPEDSLPQDSSPEDHAASLFKNIRIGFSGDFSQGQELEIGRLNFNLKYEDAIWPNSYIKLDSKFTYFHQKDDLAEAAGGDYGNAKVNDAWFQYSYKHCVAKLGYQSLFWGVVEGSYALDIINPLDATEPLLTDYSEVSQSQNIMLTNCYFSASDFELFYVPKAKVDKYSHKGRMPFEQLESRLDDEWGVRYSYHLEGIDFTLMYAHLYENTPHLSIDLLDPSYLNLESLRYDLFGLSFSWAIERLLIEADLAYKKDQHKNQILIIGQPLITESLFEAALGFEYLTSGNHQFSAGVWFFDARAESLQITSKHSQLWSFSWRKKYLNDTLGLSLLGGWVKQPERFSLTALAEYELDDYWIISSSISHVNSTLSNNDTQQSTLLSASEVSTQLSLKWQY